MRTTPRPALTAVVAVAVLAWIVRVVVTSVGWFYWDDLSFLATTRAESNPLELLFRNHDGHIMPAAWLLEWVLNTAAPLDWPVAVAVVAVLHAVALAAVGRAVWLVVGALRGRTGGGPGAAGTAAVTGRAATAGSPWTAAAAVAVPLAVYGFSPLALPGGTWLAAAVNALPLHAALALGVAHVVCAVLAVDGRGRRHGLLAAAATLVGLLFSERALFVLPAAALVVAALALAGARPARRRLVSAFGPLLGLTIVWGVLYGVLSRNGEDPAPAQPSWSGAADAFVHTYGQTLVPSFAGGPWSWERWHPGPPFVDPTAVEIVLGIVVACAVGVWTWRVRPRAVWLWLPLVVYPVFPALALALRRTAPDTAAIVANTLRHLSEVSVVAALCAAAVAGLALAERERRAAVPPSPALGVAVLLVLTAASVVTHVEYARSWADQPSRDYFAALRADAEALDGEPLLDQPVALDVLLPVMGTDNMLSRLVGGVDGYPEIANWTRTPQVIDGEGALRPAEILQLRTVTQGAEPGCGTRIPAGAGPVDVPLDGPLVDRDWTVQFNYFASAEGTVALSLGDGAPVEVPVTAGLGQATVRLLGDGEALTVSPSPGVGDMCVASGPLGGFVPK